MRWATRLEWGSARSWAAALLAGLLLLGALALIGRQTIFARDRTWEAIQARKTWRVGLDPSFPPFEQLDEAGKMTGFDIDLAQALAACWGVALELKPIGFDSLTDALRTAQIDSVISALPFDERLTRDIAYSPPYFEAGIRLAVRPESDFRDPADVQGRTLAVELGSGGDAISRTWQRTEPTLKVLRFDTPAAAIEAAGADSTIDGLLIDNVSLRLAQGAGARLVAVGEALEANPYVIAMPIAARQLQAEVEQGLTELGAAGKLTELENRWFGAMAGGR
jgi:polar amino acid transport system substrate-binding protein